MALWAACQHFEKVNRGSIEIGNLTDFVCVEFNKDVVMTMIDRTQQEQWSLYEKTDRPKTKRMSPNVRWEAVDIRDWIYTDKEKKSIGKLLNDRDDATNRMSQLGSGSPTYWLHCIKGQAMRFPIQYKGPVVYVFSDGMTIHASGSTDRLSR